MNSRVQAKSSRSNPGRKKSARPLDLRRNVRKQEFARALARIEVQKQQIKTLNLRLLEARAELNEARTRRNGIHQPSAIGQIELDQYGTILDLNAAAAELLGRNQEVLRGKPFSVFLRGKDTLRFSEHLRVCSRTSQKHALQLTLHVMEREPQAIYLSSIPVPGKASRSDCVIRTLISDASAAAILEADHSELLNQEQAARRDAERDRDFIQQVLSHAPVMMGALEGRDLRLKWFNKAAAKALGGENDGLLDRPLQDVLPEAFRSLSPVIDRIYQSGKPVFVPEFHLPLPTGTLWVQLALAPLSRFLVQSTGLVFMALDLTAIKASTEALGTSENRLRLALDAARMATCDWDFRSKKMIWFGNHHQLFGAAPPETRASFEALQNLIIPSDRGALVEAIDRAAKEGGLFDVEFRIQWPDKSIHWLQLQGQLFLQPSREPQRAIGVIIEVTQQKELEATLRTNQNLLESRVNERTAALADAISALRRENIQRQIAQGARDSLVRQLSAAQEDERRRISRELHDETGQHLTALLLGLKTLEPFLKAPDAAKQLKELQALTGQLGEEIHRIAVQLRPTSLDDLGLHKTVTNFVHEWSSRSKIAVELNIEGLDRSRLPSEIETILYRIVQESLTNVARHAEARNVCLVLQRHPRHVTLIIEDDGKGFDVGSALSAASDLPHERAHLGLLGMKERVVLVRGELEIESAPREGATLFVRIPLPGDTLGSAPAVS